jgi:hypothetical protein
VLGSTLPRCGAVTPQQVHRRTKTFTCGWGLGYFEESGIPTRTARCLRGFAKLHLGPEMIRPSWDIYYMVYKSRRATYTGAQTGDSSCIDMVRSSSPLSHVRTVGHFIVRQAKKQVTWPPMRSRMAQCTMQ